MSILFSIIIMKRIFVDGTSNISKLAFHLIIIATVMVAFRIHAVSNLAARGVPILIGLLSYYGHTQFLVFRTNKAVLQNNTI